MGITSPHQELKVPVLCGPGSPQVRMLREESLLPTGTELGRRQAGGVPETHRRTLHVFWVLGWRRLISKARFKMHNVCVSAPVLSGEPPKVRSQPAPPPPSSLSFQRHLLYFFTYQKKKSVFLKITGKRGALWRGLSFLKKK